MIEDIWHFSRRMLAEQVMTLFASGLSSALIFFAPRRMGKTEFLRKDIMPVAHAQQWQVFYFGQNLPFPLLEREFTDHLADIFKRVTQRVLDKDELWRVFLSLEKVPQLMRSLVERLALNPGLSIAITVDALLMEISDTRAYSEIWYTCTPLEKLIIKSIACEENALYGTECRRIFAEMLAIPELAVSTIQSTIRTLYRRGIIGKQDSRGHYYIDDPNFKHWTLEQE